MYTGGLVFFVLNEVAYSVPYVGVVLKAAFAFWYVLALVRSSSLPFGSYISPFRSSFGIYLTKRDTLPYCVCPLIILILADVMVRCSFALVIPT